MFGKLKQLLGESALRKGNGGSETPSTSEMHGSNEAGEIEAIRQTQVIDPTSIHGSKSAPVVQAPSQSPARHRARRRDAAMPIVNRQTPLYRPAVRPPMAFLAAFDDGSIDDAEIFRLRGGSTTIGRDDADVTFPNEVVMSKRHAQIQCFKENGRFVYRFQDLNSRNGSFFRVQRAVLGNGQEFLLGSVRFLFQLPIAGVAYQDEIDAAINRGQTDVLQTAAIATEGAQMPKLLWRDSQGREASLVLPSDHVVLGRDTDTCAVSVPGEPFVCPNHAKLFLTKSGWTLEDLGSRNGSWLRLNSATLDQLTEFQLGEQRFYFRPPTE
ncbi:MAG: FHA domain-containing protein [Planctomycetota bacterium]